ncbi:serine hydrolase domain-containing protein [Rhodococcus erythropolis]|uniref:serine hydrolase domain-containing protein n=1 Tax=Rhodococcus erythropolis TaxID=1833 RepID=UPI0008BFC8BA|nr:serine hydrolase [Rhodococcus erythropolis]MDF2467742.1 ampH [Rhodococcus erythropolis]OFV75262.1 D-alanyl-D-alanine carboxypeptidase precursor [Rhodococcus erythropolis]
MRGGSARSGRPMTTVSTLNIGSVTKTVTATAVLQLVASGRLDLNADVNDVLRQSKLYGPRSVRSPHHPDVPIRVRHLLTHLTPLSSGVDPGPYGYSYRSGAAPDPGEMGRWLHVFLTPYPAGQGTYNAEANFTTSVPGEAHMYSDIAFDLAGHLVQAVTGEYFADYCREAILVPAGMTRSDFDRDRLSVDDRAHPHAWFEDGVKTGMWFDYRNLIQQDIPDAYTGHIEYTPYITPLTPAGALRSNALDLARWVRLWLGEGSIDGREILPRQVAVDALSDHVLAELLAGSDSPVKFTAQGFSWMRLEGDPDGVWQHAGSDLGTATYVMLDTRRGIGAVVVCNTELSVDGDPRPQMLQILLESVAGE